MALLLSQAGEWLLAVCAVIRVCALYALLLFSSICTAGELEELSVTEAGGEYRLRIVSVLDAPADYVYNVITDYTHAYRINPSITEIEILPSDRNEVVRVRSRSEHWVGPFRFIIDWVGDFVETKHGHIKVITIPEFSSFESGSSIWEIRPQGERTWVLHESSLKPNFFIPPIIGDYIIKRRIVDESITTFNRIECHAMIIFEMDMENEPELLKTILKEGKDCMNLHE
ncbi:MAG: hypothetical protein GQ537_06110 [Gammaproteobacteria bacterium]|nr:hypothetical protein [Gammaproteobacteria bacterium]